MWTKSSTLFKNIPRIKFGSFFVCEKMTDMVIKVFYCTKFYRFRAPFRHGYKISANRGEILVNLTSAPVRAPPLITFPVELLPFTCSWHFLWRFPLTTPYYPFSPWKPSWTTFIISSTVMTAEPLLLLLSFTFRPRLKISDASKLSS